MRITESQLRRIIAEEIVEMYEDAGAPPATTSGEKKAEKAIGASNMASYDTAAAGVFTCCAILVIAMRMDKKNSGDFFIGIIF